MESKSVKNKVQEKSNKSKSTAEEALDLMRRELAATRDKEKLLVESIATVERLVASQKESEYES